MRLREEIGEDWLARLGKAREKACTWTETGLAMIANRQNSVGKALEALQKASRTLRISPSLTTRDPVAGMNARALAGGRPTAIISQTLLAWVAQMDMGIWKHFSTQRQV